MIALILFNLVPLGVALLIGLLTARWMFADRRRAPAKPPKENSPS
jgi:uncharacterized iron-regulated membrane protein